MLVGRPKAPNDTRVALRFDSVTLPFGVVSCHVCAQVLDSTSLAREGFHENPRRNRKNGARSRGDERWDIWMQCGVHKWQTLPRAESGEHYCPNCCTIWTADGAIKNVPSSLSCVKPEFLKTAEHPGAKRREQPRHAKH
jgi:hypothetical protein